MDIGMLGRKNQEARDLTAEIDRATDGWDMEAPKISEAVSPAGNPTAEKLATEGLVAERPAAEMPVVDFEAVRKQAITSGNLSPKAVAESNKQIHEIVAAENGYAENGLEAGANVIGAASEEEIKQRLADDQDDLQMETGSGWEHEIMKKGQDGLTTKAVKEIDQIIKQEAYKPAELEKQRLLGMHALLATYGRKLGERN